MLKPYYEEPGITIYHGDCREVLPQLPDATIDLTLTSPPYDTIRTYHGYQWDFLTTATALKRLTTAGGIVVWIVDDQKIEGSESGSRLRQACTFLDLGFKLHDTMIYESLNGAMGASNEYLQCFETMYVFSHGSPKAVHLLRDRRNIRSGPESTPKHKRTRDGTLATRIKVTAEPYGRRKNIWRYAVGGHTDASAHPAAFPLQLAMDHIFSWSDPGAMVFDPFMGAGTSILAAKELGRQAVGIEIDEHYCELAVNRLRQEVLTFDD